MGHGAIGAAAFVDSGVLDASGGVLTVNHKISGAGTLEASKSATLALDGGGTFGGVLAGAGTIDVAAPLTLTAGATRGVGTLVVSANLTLGTGENLTNATGKVLDLTAAASKTVTLAGAGADTVSNGGAFIVDGPGAAVVKTSLVNTGSLGVSAGSLTLTGAVTNSGAIGVGSGQLSIEGAVSGAGKMTVGSAGTLSLGAAVAAKETVDLTHVGLLDLGDPHGFLAAIADFNHSAGIDLLSTPVTSKSYADNVLKLLDGSSVVASLHFTGNYTLASFSIGSDNHGGTMIASNGG